MPNWSKRAFQLTCLLRKSQPWQWRPEQQAAFQDLKSCLLSFPVLRHPCFTRPWIVHVDYSQQGFGACLAQRDPDNPKLDYAVCYASRRLTSWEANMSAVEGELGCLVWAVCHKFRHYLFGAPVVEVWTDHAGLQYLSTAKNLTGRLARWMLQLAQFNLKVIYRKGTSNRVADALSRHFPRRARPQAPVKVCALLTNVENMGAKQQAVPTSAIKPVNSAVGIRPPVTTTAPPLSRTVRPAVTTAPPPSPAATHSNPLEISLNFQLFAHQAGAAVEPANREPATREPGNEVQVAVSFDKAGSSASAPPASLSSAPPPQSQAAAGEQDVVDLTRSPSPPPAPLAPQRDVVDLTRSPSPPAVNLPVAQRNYVVDLMIRSPSPPAPPVVPRHAALVLDLSRCSSPPPPGTRRLENVDALWWVPDGKESPPYSPQSPTAYSPSTYETGRVRMLSVPTAVLANRTGGRYRMGNLEMTILGESVDEDAPMADNLPVPAPGLPAGEPPAAEVLPGELPMPAPVLPAGEPPAPAMLPGALLPVPAPVLPAGEAPAPAAPLPGNLPADEEMHAEKPGSPLLVDFQPAYKALHPSSPPPVPSYSPITGMMPWDVPSQPSELPGSAYGYGQQFGSLYHPPPSFLPYATTYGQSLGYYPGALYSAYCQQPPTPYYTPYNLGHVPVAVNTMMHYPQAANPEFNTVSTPPIPRSEPSHDPKATLRTTSEELEFTEMLALLTRPDAPRSLSCLLDCPEATCDHECGSRTPEPAHNDDPLHVVMQYAIGGSARPPPTLSSTILQNEQGYYTRVFPEQFGEPPVPPQPVIIACEGPIGGGKSTCLATCLPALAALGFQVHQEPLVTYFPDVIREFYKNPPRYSLCIQTAALAGYARIPPTPLMIVERSPQSSYEVFARRAQISGTLDHTEMGVLKHMADAVPWEPTAYVYLDSSVDICHARITLRARAGEEALTENWLRSLAWDYNCMLGECMLKNKPVHILDASGSIESVATAFLEVVLSYLPHISGVTAAELLAGCTSPSLPCASSCPIPALGPQAAPPQVCLMRADPQAATRKGAGKRNKKPEGNATPGELRLNPTTPPSACLPPEVDLPTTNAPASLLPCGLPPGLQPLLPQAEPDPVPPMQATDGPKNGLEASKKAALTKPALARKKQKPKSKGASLNPATTQAQAEAPAMRTSTAIEATVQAGTGVPDPDVIDLTRSSCSSLSQTASDCIDWDSLVCTVCAKGDDESRLLICDAVDCGKLWHCYCLPPPLRSPEPPADDGQPWFCPTCSQQRTCMHADIYSDLAVMAFLQHGTLPSKEAATRAEIKRIQKRAGAYEWDEGQLFRKPTAKYPQRRRVPAPEERLPLVQRWHAEMGHVGVGKCVRMLANTYHWGSITSDVRDVISTCSACQAEKAVFKLKASLHPLPIPSFPFQSVSIDVLGPLRPTPRLMTHVVIAVDRFSRWVEAAPIPDAKSETLARFFFDHVLARWGCPVTVMSDQAQAFKHGEFAALMRVHGIRQIFSSARHAQANGLAEAYCKFFMTSLRKSIQDNLHDWDLFVPSVCRAARFTICASTRYAPIQLLTGRNARIATEKDLVHFESTDKELETLHETIGDLAADATINMQKAQARQQADYDRRRPMDAGSLPDPGSYVLVHRVRGDKCTKRCDGPFLCIGFNPGRTICLLEGADGKRWTENIERIAPFRVPEPGAPPSNKPHATTSPPHEQPTKKQKISTELQDVPVAPPLSQITRSHPNCAETR